MKGYYLTLMIGPAVPVPVPQSVLDGLNSVEVTQRDEGTSAFQLNFTLSSNSPLHTIFLLGGGAASAIPLLRVIIVVTVNGTPNVLMDGVVTNIQVQGGQDSVHNTLVVTGEDLTHMMDWIDMSGMPYPAMPSEARVALILAKYAMFGIIPLVIPSIMMDVPIPTQEIPRQQGTDLAYIRLLADTVGYVFYLDPGPVPGSSVAYWGPQIKVGVPQPALNVNMDAFNNVENLSFSFDDSSKTLPVIFIQNPESKAIIPIPIPDITPLNPPLGAVPPLPRTVTYLSETAKLNPVQAAIIGLTKAARSSDVVSATGSLDVVRYGQALKPRGLVGVRGVGMAYDGLYYVKQVSHKLQSGQYKQDFTLTRNGLISTVPKVPA